jgi:hypothetical protein
MYPGRFAQFLHMRIVSEGPGGPELKMELELELELDIVVWLGLWGGRLCLERRCGIWREGMVLGGEGVVCEVK